MRTILSGFLSLFRRIAPIQQKERRRHRDRCKPSDDYLLCGCAIGKRTTPGKLRWIDRSIDTRETGSNTPVRSSPSSSSTSRAARGCLTRSRGFRCAVEFEERQTTATKNAAEEPASCVHDSGRNSRSSVEKRLAADLERIQDGMDLNGKGILEESMKQKKRKIPEYIH